MITKTVEESVCGNFNILVHPMCRLYNVNYHAIRQELPLDLKLHHSWFFERSCDRVNVYFEIKRQQHVKRFQPKRQMAPSHSSWSQNFRHFIRQIILGKEGKNKMTAIYGWVAAIPMINISTCNIPFLYTLVAFANCTSCVAPKYYHY